jgi:glycosyltransferase involved in cell wall biosynthesis
MKISACLIVKNEEKTLPRCLDSVKDIVSEIIVVDTGSTDRTVEVAESYGAKIYHFEWINDFAAAKNYAISKARGNWIIFLDADEYFTSDSIPLIPDIIKKAHKNKYDFIMGYMSHLDTGSNKLFESSFKIRIFRNDVNIRYKGAIHEMIVRTNYPARVLDATSQIKMIHTGYSPETIQDKDKSTRNLDLLFKEWEKNPNSDLAFYIAESYMVGKDYENGLKYAYKVFEYQNGTLIGIYEKNYINIISCMNILKRPAEEIISTVYEACQKYPTVPDFYFYLGDLYVKANRNFDAVQAFEKGLTHVLGNVTLRSGAHFHTTNVYKTLGQLYYKLGNLQKSVECYVNSLKIDKYNYRTLVSLLTLLCKHENIENVIGFLEKLYDRGNLKDNLLIVEAALDIRNAVLVEYFGHNLFDQAATELSEQYAHLQYLKGNFADAAKRYHELYLATDKEELAVKIVAAALYSKDENLIKLYGKDMPEKLYALYHAVSRGGRGTEELDRESLFRLLDEHIQMKRWEELLACADLIESYRLLLDVAESFVRQEEFAFAVEFYDMFLQREQEIEEDMVSLILIKMADCLYQIGDYQTSLQLLEQAQSQLPTEYAAYELQLRIYDALNDTQSMMRVAKAGQMYFPDSGYLNSVSLHH